MARRNPICKYFSYLSAEINDGRGKLVASLCRIQRDFHAVYPGDLIFDFSKWMARGIPWDLSRRNNARTLERSFSNVKRIAKYLRTLIVH